MDRKAQRWQAVTINRHPDKAWAVEGLLQKLRFTFRPSAHRITIPWRLGIWCALSFGHSASHSVSSNISSFGKSYHAVFRKKIAASHSKRTSVALSLSVSFHVTCITAYEQQDRLDGSGLKINRHQSQLYQLNINRQSYSIRVNECGRVGLAMIN